MAVDLRIVMEGHLKNRRLLGTVYGREPMRHCICACLVSARTCIRKYIEDGKPFDRGDSTHHLRIV